MSTPRLDSDGLFPWRYFLRALYAAFTLRCLLLAAAGVALASLSGLFLSAEFQLVPLAAPVVQRALLGPLFAWYTASAPLGLAVAMQGSLRIDVVLATVWSLLVWGVFGGMISREAALRLVHREPAPLRKAARSALAKWPARVAPPVVLLILSLALLAPLWLHAVMLGVSILNLVSAILLPIALLFTMAAAALAVVVALAWPLMIVGPSIDRSDAFDNAGATLSYATQRLPQLAAYLATALIVAMPVGVVIESVTRVLARFVTLLPHASPQGIAFSDAAAGLAEFWTSSLLWLFPAAFYAAYFWSAVTAIYLLLRRDVDGRMVDEVVE